MLLGSSVFGSYVQVDECSVMLGTFVRRAFFESELTVAQWNDLDEAARDRAILAAIHTMKAERGVPPRVSVHVEPGRPVHVPHEDLQDK